MLKTIILASSAVMLSFAAQAHVTLENQQAAIGSTYKAVLRVPHGCKGSATVAVRLLIPEGFTGIKAMPKPGWKLETIRDESKKVSGDHGTSSSPVKEVSWSGGKLLDENYDEFVVRGSLSDTLKPGETLYFPIVQQCEDGVARWIDVPKAGQKSSDFETPAPGLKLLPKP